ncbi:hypothetical protein DL98DRAFT_514770 [Cadophora sp. DSE1049]|nr:hypothetical protein DL98DRAFT_514770 [Cadophora sp. DSE1049]
MLELHEMALSNPIFRTSHPPKKSIPKLAIQALTTQSPTTFPLFPTLPPELRLRIWRLCLPGPRFIRPNGRCTCDPLNPNPAVPQRTWPITTFSTTNPTLLSVNRESRNETLRHYAIIYSEDGHSSLAFDKEKDIYFPYPHACCNLSPSVFSTSNPSRHLFTIPSYAPKKDVQVRRLAVHEGMLESKMATLVGEWIALDELIVVVTPRSNLVWPHSIYRERERILTPGAVVKDEGGWGDGVVLNRLMRGLEGGSKEDGRENGKGRIPLVKVVLPRVMEESDDPFCVRITPLSLRK